MITRAMLHVAHPEMLAQRLGGMSVLERQLFTLARAGINRVWINAVKPRENAAPAPRLPENLELIWSLGPAQEECLPPYLSVSANYFIRVETLRCICRSDHKIAMTFTDSRQGAPIQVVTAFKSAAAIAHEKQSLPLGASVLLEAPLAEGPALDWLLSTGPKSHDGFMARHFDRYISLEISRRLLDTGVTPNLMTVLSCALGLIGAAFFAFPRAYCDIAGATMIWLHSVLDGCDGELARIRFQESRLGGDIDFWGDNLVHLALFGCLSAGFYRATASALSLALGACAALGILGSATIAFRQKLGRMPLAEEGGSQSMLSRLEALLAQRDFIYLLLIMAYWHMTYYFLWAGAVGAPLFLIVMLAAGKPHPHAYGAQNA